MKVELLAEPRRLAVSVGEVVCAFVPIGWINGTADADRALTTAPFKISVEWRRAAGGKWYRALAGATYQPSEGSRLEINIAHSGRVHGPDARTDCDALLGHKLVTGMAKEFARGLLDGLMVAREPLPPGRLTVLAGGEDPVDSSHNAFMAAGYLMRWSISRLAMGQTLDEAALGDFLYAKSGII